MHIFHALKSICMKLHIVQKIVWHQIYIALYCTPSSVLYYGNCGVVITVSHNIEIQLNQKNLQELKPFTSYPYLLLQSVLLFKMPFTTSKETTTVHRELFSIKAFYIKHKWQISSLMHLHHLLWTLNVVFFRNTQGRSVCRIHWAKLCLEIDSLFR